MRYGNGIDFKRDFTNSTVIIADPFIEQAAAIGARLTAMGLRVVQSATLNDAMSKCLDLNPAYVLTELRFSDGSGLNFVRWVSARFPLAKTVVHTWFADIPTAVAATKAGAQDLVPKPTDEEFLINILLRGSAQIPAECRIEKPTRIQREHIEQVMKFSKSNVSIAARKLHLHRRSLQRMLNRYKTQTP